jgi:7-carboxy-7-deazaguanine synthase
MSEQEPLGSSGLPVVETFHSLQGEGLHAGRSAFFIRLGGCRVGCSWCDTKHSWPAEVHPQQSLEELALACAEAASAGAAFVVPIHLETSGVDPLTGSPDWISLSPKRHQPPRAELLQRCDELKVVVHEAADLLFAEVSASQAPQATWLLQPGWDCREGQALALEFVQSQPRWRLSLQSHKWLGVR